MMAIVHMMAVVCHSRRRRHDHRYHRCRHRGQRHRRNVTVIVETTRMLLRASIGITYPPTRMDPR